TITAFRAIADHCSHHEFGLFLARQARVNTARAAGEIKSAFTTRRCSRRPSAQALRTTYSGTWNRAAACAGVSKAPGMSPLEPLENRHRTTQPRSARRA